MTTPYSKITEIGRNILPLKEFVMRKTKPISCFSYENDILWVVTLFTKQGRYKDELIFLIINIGVDGWIILGRVSRSWDVGIWTGLGWPRIGTGGGRL